MCRCLSVVGFAACGLGMRVVEAFAADLAGRTILGIWTIGLVVGVSLDHNSFDYADVLTIQRAQEGQDTCYGHPRLRDFKCGSINTLGEARRDGDIRRCGFIAVVFGREESAFHAGLCRLYYGPA